VRAVERATKQEQADKKENPAETQGKDAVAEKRITEDKTEDHEEHAAGAVDIIVSIATESCAQGLKAKIARMRRTGWSGSLKEVMLQLKQTKELGPCNMAILIATVGGTDADWSAFWTLLFEAATHVGRDTGPQGQKYGT